MNQPKECVWYQVDCEGKSCEHCCQFLSIGSQQGKQVKEKYGVENGKTNNADRQAD